MPAWLFCMIEERPMPSVGARQAEAGRFRRNGSTWLHLRSGSLISVTQLVSFYLRKDRQNQLWKPLTMHLCACNLAINITHGISYLQHALGLWPGFQQWLPWHFSLCSCGHLDILRCVLMCVGKPGYTMCPPGSDCFRYQDRAEGPGLWASASSSE